MAMYLLDTNICVALLNSNRKVEQRFSREFPIVVTNNIRDFENIPGLRLEDWIAQ